METKVIKTKVPINTLPMELRMKIYDMSNPDFYIHFTFGRGEDYFDQSWARIIYLSSILNDKETLQLAATQRDEIRENICELIALSGNLPALKWARNESLDIFCENDDHDPCIQKCRRMTPIPWHGLTASNAITYGYFQLLKWAHEHGCPLDEVSLWEASSRGDLDLIKWLHSKGCDLGDDFTFRNATFEGNLDMLKYLFDNGCPWDDDTFDTAAEDGDIAILEFLHKNHCPWNERTFNRSIGRCENMKWLHEHGCPFDLDSLWNDVLKWGDLETMKFVYEAIPYPEISALLMELVARFNVVEPIEILTWLHDDVGYKWDEGVFFSAVSRPKNFEVLEFLQKNACPFNPSSVYSIAALNGDVSTLTWLLDNKYPWDKYAYIVSRSPANEYQSISPKGLQWLLDHGCPWDQDTCAKAAKQKEWDTLKWLHHHGCPWDKRVLFYALKYGNEEIFDWARSCGCPFDENSSMTDCVIS